MARPVQVKKKRSQRTRSVCPTYIIRWHQAANKSLTNRRAIQGGNDIYWVTRLQKTHEKREEIVPGLNYRNMRIVRCCHLGQVKVLE